MPFGSIPVVRNLIASASLQPLRPAMFADLSAQPGTGTVGLNISTEPWRCFSMTGSPFSFIGVWQSAHMPIFSTRYSPRFSFSDWAVLPELAFCASAPAVATTPKRQTAAFPVKIFNDSLLSWWNFHHCAMECQGFRDSRLQSFAVRPKLDQAARREVAGTFAAASFWRFLNQTAILQSSRRARITA